jgi:hypothetical protein
VIAARGPGPGMRDGERSDPTAKSDQSPGTSTSGAAGRSWTAIPEPATMSRTVRVASPMLTSPLRA